jgi:hypothetical protein
MKPLAKTNRYLKDPVIRQITISRNATDSSAFEGAIGLGSLYPKTISSRSISPRRKAVAKNAVKPRKSYR